MLQPSFLVAFEARELHFVATESCDVGLHVGRARALLTNICVLPSSLQAKSTHRHYISFQNILNIICVAPLEEVLEHRARRLKWWLTRLPSKRTRQRAEFTPSWTKPIPEKSNQ